MGGVEKPTPEQISGAVVCFMYLCTLHKCSTCPYHLDDHAGCALVEIVREIEELIKEPEEGTQNAKKIQ